MRQKAVLRDSLAGFSDDIKLSEKVKSDARRGERLLAFEALGH
jgi:hypothetical protein